jgi:hypothetical protein
VISVAVALLVAAAPELRREENLDFIDDAAFQNSGGIQFFYAFATPQEARAAPEGSALARLRALDDRAMPGERLYVLMSRLVYTLDRDISFFTEARSRDVNYLNSVAPEVRATVNARGVFHADLTPANNFTIEWQEPVHADSPLLPFLPKSAKPASIIVQRNFDFARVMGFRTAERSVTWTAHVPLGVGRTRVVVCTISLMHNIPPPFLGGKQRVYREMLDNTAMLVARLREYPGP